MIASHLRQLRSCAKGGEDLARLRILLAAIALLAPLPAVAQKVFAAAEGGKVPGMVSRADPKVTPWMWITDDDYPSAALRSGEEGKVIVTLTIDTVGRVSGCDVYMAVGVPVLAQESCRILTRRARFTPARDKDRKPMPDRWSATVTWEFPAGIRRPPPVPVPPKPPAPPVEVPASVTAAPDVAPVAGLTARARPQFDPTLWFTNDDYPAAALRAEQEARVGLLLDIASDGRVDTCSTLSSGGVELLANASCRMLIRRARFTPALGKDGKPAPDRWSVSIDWKVPPFPPREPFTTLPECVCVIASFEFPHPKPLGDANAWITPADHPPELRGRSGSLVLSLVVDHSGAPRICRVTEYSGVPKWDRMACGLLRRRARFQPEREADEKWSSHGWQYRYSWDETGKRIPQED
jgi:TonB family protein